MVVGGSLASPWPCLRLPAIVGAGSYPLARRGRGSQKAKEKCNAMVRILIVLVALLVAAPVSAQPSLLGDVQAERAKYGDMTTAQVAALLNAVAARNPGWGLLSKPQGFNCPAPQGPVACDILVYGPTGTHFDVLIDAEGDARPTWDNKGPIDMSRFIAPVGGSVPSPVPVPTPAYPPAVDLSGVVSRLAVLESGQTALYQQAERIYADLVARQQALAQQIAAVDARLERHDAEPGWLTKMFKSGKTYAVIAGLVGGYLTRETVQ